jgi:excisionase family DNA binding protein
MPEVSRALRVSERTVARLIRAGRLAATKAANGDVRVTRTVLDKYRADIAAMLGSTVSVAQAARALACSASSIRRLVAAGDLECHPAATGKALRITRVSVRAYGSRLAGRRVTGRPLASRAAPSRAGSHRETTNTARLAGAA